MPVAGSLNTGQEAEKRKIRTKNRDKGGEGNESGVEHNQAYSTPDS